MNSFIKCSFLIIVIANIIACKRGNVNVDRDLEKHFTNNNVKGSFGMFDNGHGQFTLYPYNEFKDSAYLPASCFNIVSTLIALETGVATNDSTIIPWDGIKTANENLNKDLMLSEAFKLNSNAHYQTLVKTIGKNYLKKYMDSVKLGNYKTLVEDTANWNKNLGEFWSNNTLKITADEMLGLVKKLYFKQLPSFQKRSHEITLKLLQKENKDNLYSLSYTTGLGINQNKEQIGWVAGWIEENKHPYFFVLNLIDKTINPNLETQGIKMLKDILTEKGFFKGKK